MIEQEILTVEVGYTDWTITITIVKKNKKNLRMFPAFKFLNQTIKDTQRQLRTLAEIIPELILFFTFFLLISFAN